MPDQDIVISFTIDRVLKEKLLSIVKDRGFPLKQVYMEFLLRVIETGKVSFEGSPVNSSAVSDPQSIAFSCPKDVKNQAKKILKENGYTMTAALRAYTAYILDEHEKEIA